MLTFRQISVWAFCAAWVLGTSPAMALTLKIDYTYDTSHFFGNDNPQGPAAGAQARAALEAAASFYSGILNDTLSSIQTPSPFHSSVFGGTITWQWTASFPNPSAGGSSTLNDQVIPADQYVIYAGARSLAGNVIGEGAPGGFGWSRTPSGGGFTPQEQTQWQQIENSFVSAVTTRGEATGFARWGGSLAVDTDASANWNFDYLSPPLAGTNDFYSVVLHELAHALGFGASSEWSSRVSGATFVGSSAIGVYHQPVPLASVTDTSHWLNGLASRVFNGTANQEALMDPSLTTGSRKLLTRIDAAGLVDIGWEIALPTGIPGDFNHNGIVDAADYSVWRDSFGQTGSGLAADANGNNLIDANDFDIWKANFGQNAASGNGSDTPSGVPEPTSIILSFFAVCWASHVAARAAKAS